MVRRVLVGLLLLLLILVGIAFGGLYRREERFSPYFSFVVGDDSSIFFFLHDRDDAQLRELFPTFSF